MIKICIGILSDILNLITINYIHFEYDTLPGIQIHIQLLNVTALISKKSCEKRFKDAHISVKTVLYRNKREIIGTLHVIIIECSGKITKCQRRPIDSNYIVLKM